MTRVHAPLRLALRVALLFYEYREMFPGDRWPGLLGLQGRTLLKRLNGLWSQGLLGDLGLRVLLRRGLLLREADRGLAFVSSILQDLF